jgi:predicted nucleotide-binding protein
MPSFWKGFRSRLYALIDRKVQQTHLPRELAAIALASERGIGIARFATSEQLAEIRQVARAAAPAPVVVPASTAPVARPKRTGKSLARRPLRRGKLARRRGTSVFVVHGRNEHARRELFVFLRALGLQPIEWNQALRMTKQASPYVGAILDTAFREAVAVVVLFTPDDEARLRAAYRKKREPLHERNLSGQARPNVLFEAGMAFGRNPDSTVLVELGDLRPFSDIGGRHIVHLSNQATSRQELATKLANAGCNVDTSGQDWLEAGDLSLR